MYLPVAKIGPMEINLRKVKDKQKITQRLKLILI